MTKLNTANREGATLETAPTLYVEGSGIRFAYRRLASEWFALTPADVAAFRRWKEI